MRSHVGHRKFQPNLGSIPTCFQKEQNMRAKEEEAKQKEKERQEQARKEQTEARRKMFVAKRFSPEKFPNIVGLGGAQAMDTDA